MSGVTSASTVGSKKYGPMSGRCWPPASTVAPFSTASSTWRRTVSSWLLTRDRFVAQSRPIAQPQRRGRPWPAEPGELVVEAVVDVDALEADAQLAGAGEAAADGAVHGRVEVGVVEDDHAFLPPSSSEQSTSRCAACVAMSRPVVVLPVNTGSRPRRGSASPRSAPRPGTMCRRSGGQAGLVQQLRRPQRGERGLGVGLDEHGVAGHERGQRVGDAERQRVVPRAR